MLLWVTLTSEKWWIKHCKGRGQSVEARCPQLRVIWVSCQGVTAADEENLGSLNYTPLQGFPGFFFPFLGQNSYERWKLIASSVRDFAAKPTTFFCHYFSVLLSSFRCATWPPGYSWPSTVSSGPGTSDTTRTTPGLEVSTLRYSWTEEKKKGTGRRLV